MIAIAMLIGTATKLSTAVVLCCL